MQTSQQLKKHKRRLKSGQTYSERLLAQKLDEAGIPYKAQMVLGFYILDFCIPTKMINIEVDGDIHNDQHERDYLRDKFTQECGFTVIRVRNQDVKEFDARELNTYPSKSLSEFRSGLSKGNVLRSKAMIKKMQAKALLGIPRV